jgi:dTDP-4-dehydrorhamnose reductase
MRILVTGKNGQLGRSIHKAISANSTEINTYKNLNEFIFVGRGELDLSQEEGVANYFYNNKFDIIINCAAYTVVDKAEEEQELANQVNHLAVKQLAKIANKQQAKLIHISTDYVFDGESDKPYTETDKTNPINVYGKTKLAGEKALQEVMPTNAIIVRISWLYSEFGSNFVNTMLRIGKERDDVRVISDQIGSPTYTADVAKVLLHIVLSKKIKMNFNSEIYHYSAKGLCSWYNFSKSIFEYKKINCKAIPIKEREWSAKMQRPKYSALDNHKIQRQFKVIVPFWLDSLHTCLDKIEK